MCTQQLLPLILFPCWNHLPDPQNYQFLLPFVPNTITKTIAGSDIDSYFYWRFSKYSCICSEYRCVSIVLTLFPLMPPFDASLSDISVNF